MQSFGTWEPGPLAGFARCDPSKIGKFNKRRQDHVPEQSHPHRLPRQRCRSSHQQPASASPLSRSQPSPPTRTGAASTSRTPNGIVASSSASSRSSPRRSPRAHMSRSKANCAAGSTTARRTDSKQRIWEIRVDSILKLDRAEKAAPEDQEHDESPQEEPAA